ncbi:oligopeptide transporter, OPT family, partial [Anaerobutyricum soehngenii]|nr:oligopeptide transporter, OPT family [Anaerobutyricum soehngenii]
CSSVVMFCVMAVWFVMVLVFGLLNAVWGVGSSWIALLKATVMRRLVDGSMNAERPRALIVDHVFIALLVSILPIQVPQFAVGLCRPSSLTARILACGLA